MTSAGTITGLAIQPGIPASQWHVTIPPGRALTRCDREAPAFASWR